MATNADSQMLFQGDALRDQLACGTDGIPADTTELIHDAYENDDFWLPPSQQVLAKNLLSTGHSNNSSSIAANSGQWNSTFPVSRTLPVAQQGHPHIHHQDLTQLLCGPHEHERCKAAAVGCQMGRSSNATGLTADHADLAHLSGYQNSVADCDIMNDMEPLPIDSFKPYVGMTLARAPRISKQAETGLLCALDPAKKTTSVNLSPPCNGANVVVAHKQRRSKEARVARSKKTLPKKETRQARNTVAKNDSALILPLSAYNFFFRVERVRLLEVASSCNEQGNQNLNEQVYLSNALFFYSRIFATSSGDFQDIVLHDQWGRDATVKRKHRKSHGQISFGSLARLISQSWRNMPDEIKQVFYQISERDFDRFELEKRKISPAALP